MHGLECHGMTSKCTLNSFKILMPCSLRDARNALRNVPFSACTHVLAAYQTAPGILFQMLRVPRHWVNVNGRKTLSGVLLIAAHEIMEIAWCISAHAYFLLLNCIRNLLSYAYSPLSNESLTFFFRSFKILNTKYRTIYNNKLIF